MTDVDLVGASSERHLLDVQAAPRILVLARHPSNMPCSSRDEGRARLAGIGSRQTSLTRPLARIKNLTHWRG